MKPTPLEDAFMFCLKYVFFLLHFYIFLFTFNSYIDFFLQFYDFALIFGNTRKHLTEIGDKMDLKCAASRTLKHVLTYRMEILSFTQKRDNRIPTAMERRILGLSPKNRM